MAALTVNAILDNFVPRDLQNDLQRLRSIVVSQQDEQVLILVGFENDQIVLRVEQYDAPTTPDISDQGCRVVVVSTDRESGRFFPGLVAQLTWVFQVLATWGSPSSPRILVALRHHYRNAHLLHYIMDEHMFEFEIAGGGGGGMPAAAPVLAH